jgi:hypothetical protein
MNNVVEFPKPGRLSPKRRSRENVRHGPNMHALLFRSYDLIVESDEADLVRDVGFNIDRAQTKLKAVRRQLQSVQERSAAQVQLLTAANTKLTAAIVVVLLSTKGGNTNA